MPENGLTSTHTHIHSVKVTETNAKTIHLPDAASVDIIVEYLFTMAPIDCGGCHFNMSNNA